MSEAFIQAVRGARDGPAGIEIEGPSGAYYLELGRRMAYPLSLTPAPTRAQLTLAITAGECAALFPAKERRMQATIRNISIAKRLQRKGYFTALVKFLLERDGAVHMEAVQERWMKRRLAASPLWVCQSIGEERDPVDDFNPCYARFTLNEPFTLF